MKFHKIRLYLCVVRGIPLSIVTAVIRLYYAKK